MKPSNSADLSRRRTPAGRSSGRGYTLIEMLATVSVLGIATALAVPGMRTFIQNNRAANEANALVGALALARNEAVTRGFPVAVCPSGDGATCAAAANWVNGWIVFTDPDADNVPDEVLRIYEPLGTGSTLVTAADRVSYQPSGFIAAGAEIEFSLQVPDCTGTNNRTVTINPQGRASVAHMACQVADDG